MPRDTGAVNEALLDLVNGGLAGRWDLLDDWAVWWAKDGVFLLLALAGLFGIWELRQSPRRGLLVAGIVTASAVLAGTAILFAGDVIHEARPFVADRDTVQLLKHNADNSFPSDHATLAGVVAMAAALTWRRWAALFVVVGLLVGISRVVSGVHYPGDILAGWSIGALSVAAVWLVVSRSRFAAAMAIPERTSA